MGKDKVTPDQAYDIGKRGGTVDTNGMTHQEKEKIDAAVNAGKASNTKK
jgi:hypothetical protein